MNKKRFGSHSKVARMSFSFPLSHYTFPLNIIGNILQLELVRKHACGPVTDTECQLQEQMLKQIFLELFLQTSANVNKQNIATIFLNMTRSSNIIMY